MKNQSKTYAELGQELQAEIERLVVIISKESKFYALIYALLDLLLRADLWLSERIARLRKRH